MCRKQVRTMALGLLVLLLSGCGAQTVEPAKILAEEVKITSNNLHIIPQNPTKVNKNIKIDKLFTEKE